MRSLKNMTGRNKIGLGGEIFEASRPWDVKNFKPMANPAACMLVPTSHKKTGHAAT